MKNSEVRDLTLFFSLKQLYPHIYIYKLLSELKKDGRYHRGEESRDRGDGLESLDHVLFFFIFFHIYNKHDIYNNENTLNWDLYICMYMSLLYFLFRH